MESWEYRLLMGESRSRAKRGRVILRKGQEKVSLKTGVRGTRLGKLIERIGGQGGEAHLE